MPDSTRLRLAYPQLSNLVSIYKEDIWYWVSGIKFREFMLGVPRPIGVLLLDHDYKCAEMDWQRTRLEYVDTDLNSLIADEPINYGDFWWMDFCSREAISGLPEAELLELLYLKQLGTPLKSPYFPTLRNRFIYCGHDDGWALRLWVDQPARLERILAQVIALKFAAFSAQRDCPVPHEALCRELVARAEHGVCLDFRAVDARSESVPIYSLGPVKNLSDAQRLAEQLPERDTQPERLRLVDDEWTID